MKKVTIGITLFLSGLISIGYKVFKVFMLVEIILLGIGIYSCRQDPYRSEILGDFIYTKLNCDDGYVRIIGLSPEGKKKETLVFPSILDGYKVVSLGAKFALKRSDPIVITNASKVYFPGHYIEPGQVIFELNENVKSLSVYLGKSDDRQGNLYPSFEPGFYNENYKIFRSNAFYQDWIQSEEIEDAFEQRANVCYYLDEQTTYFVDDVDGTVVNVIPPTPYKEGFEFIGWYKDPKHQEEWNFEEDIIPAKKYNENGEYEFVETRIYAAWEKIK